MKHRLAFIFVFVTNLSILSLGQTYETIFGQSSTQWNISFCQLDQARVIERVAFEDTTMFGSNYKKVGTKQGNTIYHNVSPSEAAHGFLREDTTLGKIWFRGAKGDVVVWDTVEYLVADMSLTLGDSFVVNLHPFGVGDTTAIVDSIYYQSGLKHIRLNYVPFFVWGGNKLTFIEGIGTNYGFAYMHLGTIPNLCLCLQNYSKDSNLVYIHNSCPITNSSTKIKDQPNLEVAVYPHPITQQSVLQFDNHSHSEVALLLYNSTGQVINQYHTTGNSFTLSSKMHKGLCFYQLRINTLKVAEGKLLFLD
ncbi:T9SS type A sorting domain-containing protein [Aureispira anguillae]|uniref:Secretion system C-terminal sorting domain-containing protein n=1 Tax=Aureispira anguillae TaxID=2864201 RepID=A0A915YDN5_9BACT|nr:hypothetical protein [Aureispira anguillae]BDS11189.1 hypothetical protein AsAng_0019000 [Aureispira anguillae]